MSEEKKENVYDCIIIGSGPAGHGAAIYASRGKVKTIMFEGMCAGGIPPGGQLTTTTHIENYPGVDIKTMGSDLMDSMRDQSEHHGTEIVTKTVSKVELSCFPLKVWCEGEEDGEPTLGKSIIVATGATANRLNVKGEELYWQQGISACAVCDGAIPYFRNKVIAVVGGGDSAVEEAIFLTKYASKVVIIMRRDKMRASKVMADRAHKNPKIEILCNKVVDEALGDGNKLTKLMLKDVKTGEKSELPVGGMFYAIGHTPNTSVFKGKLDLDDVGYIIRSPAHGGRVSHTNVKGVFAAGDVVDKVYRQAITAAASGCQAALDCLGYLEELDDQL